MEWPRPAVTARWTAGALIAAGGVYPFARAVLSGSGDIPLFGKSLLGLFAIISGGVLAAPEIVLWIVSPVHGLLDRLFLPSESEPPPVDFTLARLYGSQLRYGDACEQYLEIIRYHPEEASAYLEGIQAAQKAGDMPLARKFYRGARRMMRTPEQRRLLESVCSVRYELSESTGGEERAAR